MAANFVQARVREAESMRVFQIKKFSPTKSSSSIYSYIYMY